MMSLPPLAPVPPSSIRLSIAPEEWEACLESWITLSELYLRQPTGRPSTEALLVSSVPDFLKSFYHEKVRAQPEDSSFRSPTALKLQKTCFLLTHHLFFDGTSPPELLEFTFLARFCRVHARNVSLPRLMDELWKGNDLPLQKSLEMKKHAVLKALEGPSSPEVSDILQQLADVFRASPDAALVFMTGSDFLDALALQYEKSNPLHERKFVVASTYFGLLSLVKIDHPNLSLLSDHLYTLKAQADKSSVRPSLLADLVTNTPIIAKLGHSVPGSAADRLTKLLGSLETYRSPSIAQPRKRTHRKPQKGKGKASHIGSEMHVHRMSLVTQVQDLFPDLGSGFILKLLDEYRDDVEQVTAHLLDDSFPAHIRHLDRSEEAPLFTTTREEEIDQLAPRSMSPLQPFIPDRRNVFDDDELDRLEVDTGRLHLGRKKEKSVDESQPNKAAILSALAAFDSDDDERDDTYDVDDVGGTVDTAHPDGEPGPAAKIPQEENDAALFTAYKSAPALFARTTDVRRGQARQTLRAETGMTDEAIEGWAIMIRRDPRRLKRLEEQVGSFDGKQTGLAKTAYRESPGGTETEDSDFAPTASGTFRGRGRGRGRGGGSGRGGNVAGPSSDPNTTAVQRRKEASKSSRANHNRRDQRAKKMARGGFTG